MWKNNVPIIASWTITLVQSAPPPNCHHHLQLSSTDLASCLMYLHSQLKLHQQWSILKIFKALWAKYILSQPGRLQWITRPSGVRKHSKTNSKFDRSSQASHIQPFTTYRPSSQSIELIAHLILQAGCHYSNSTLQYLSYQLHYVTACSQHQFSNAVGGDPFDAESNLVQLTDTGKVVYHLIWCLHQRYWKLSYNLYMDNVFTTQHLLAELHWIGIGACGTWRQQSQVFPKKLKVGKNAKLSYHFQSGVVNDWVATWLYMDSSPVTMMSTIHPVTGKDSLVLRMRKHPSNKSTNASWANSTLLSGECQKKLDIPVVVDAYNQCKVGVDDADQYRIYFDTQLISRHTWHPLFYWILERALSIAS